MQNRKESLDVVSPGQLWFPSLDSASSDSCMVFRKISYRLRMAVSKGALLWRLQYWTPCFVVSTRGWTPLFFFCFDHGWLFSRNPINQFKKSVVEGIFEETCFLCLLTSLSLSLSLSLSFSSSSLCSWIHIFVYHCNFRIINIMSYPFHFCLFRMQRLQYEN